MLRSPRTTTTKPSGLSKVYVPTDDSLENSEESLNAEIKSPEQIILDARTFIEEIKEDYLKQIAENTQLIENITSNRNFPPAKRAPILHKLNYRITILQRLNTPLNEALEIISKILTDINLATIYSNSILNVLHKTATEMQSEGLLPDDNTKEALGLLLGLVETLGDTLSSLIRPSTAEDLTKEIVNPLQTDPQTAYSLLPRRPSANSFPLAT